MLGLSGWSEGVLVCFFRCGADGGLIEWDWCSYGGREMSLEARAKKEVGLLKADGKEVVEKGVEKGKEMVERVKDKVVR